MKVLTVLNSPFPASDRLVKAKKEGALSGAFHYFKLIAPFTEGPELSACKLRIRASF